MLRFLSLFLIASTVTAATQAPSSHEQIKQKLAPLLSGMPIDSIEQSIIPGLYEVLVGGTEVLYVSPDGRYLMVGEMLDLNNQQKNLTELKKTKGRLKLVKEIDPKTFITFKAQQEKHQIYVFTDVDCGYCRKLQNEEVASLNKQGVTVHYLAFPRAGAGSKTYNTMVSAWCASNPQQALADVKQGKAIPEKKCAHPIDKHLQLVHRLRLNGTPAIVLDDGRMIPGYQPAKELVAALSQ